MRLDSSVISFMAFIQSCSVLIVFYAVFGVWDVGISS